MLRSSVLAATVTVGRVYEGGGHGFSACCSLTGATHATQAAHLGRTLG